MKIATLALIGAVLLVLTPSSWAKDYTYGPWHGAFNTGFSTFDIVVDLDHLAGSRTGGANISIIPTRPDRTDTVCPREAHPDFCYELVERLKQETRDAFRTLGLGVLFPNDNEAYIAFAFSDEETVRMLSLRRDGKGASIAETRIYHPVRGLDLHVKAKPHRHFCETETCSAARLDDLAENESRAFGFFRDNNFIASFYRKGDFRADVHAEDAQHGRPVRQESFGTYLSVGQFMTAVWLVRDAEGRDMGELRIFATGTRYWGGRGELDERPHFGMRSSIELEESSRSDDHASFKVTYFADGSGERVTGDLVIDLPRTPRDTISARLTQGDSQIPVNLKRLGSYEGESVGDSH
ncbi:MAG: hypothetical protein AAGE89_01795 [Pseudomonadota bacterium]